MSSALLSVLASREIQQHVMLILIGPHVRHFSDGNQTLKKIMASHYAKIT
jgi:hypothetical protein